MQVLLINQNATIERLVSLSTGKLLYELDKVASLHEVGQKDYDFIIIDSDLYEKEGFTALKNSALGATFIMMLSKGFERPGGIDIFVEKPFLPTELVDILSTARAHDTSIDNMSAPIPTLASFDDISSEHDHGIPSLDDIENKHSSQGEAVNEDEIHLEDMNALLDIDDNSSNEIDLNEIELDELGLDGEKRVINDKEVQLDDIQIPEVGHDMDFEDIPKEDSISISDSDMGDIGVREDDGIPDLNLDDLNFEDDTKEDVVAHKEEDFDLDALDGFGSIKEDDVETAPEPMVDVESDNETITELDDIDFGDAFKDDKPLSEKHGDEEMQIDSDEESDTKYDELLGGFDDIDSELLEQSAVVSSEDELVVDEKQEDAPITYSDEDENNDKDGEESRPAMPSSIFGDDEVQKLKDLLGEDEVVDDDMGDMKIQNDEFASLTEESVADALGMDYSGGHDEDLTEIGLENLDSPSGVYAEQKPESGSGENKQQSAEVSGTDLLTLPVERIKDLLEIADITINITLSKKR